MRTVALLGNPNSGKTTLFNALTGAHQRVGNWNGVTVTQKEGVYVVQNTRVRIIDLPGIYTLAPGSSPDQQVTVSYLAHEHFDHIVQVVDATQLARHLYLTIQLRERGLPVILALNKIDICTQQRQHIDIAALSAALGCPVIPISSARREGLAALGAALVTPQMPIPFHGVHYPETLGAQPILPDLESALESDLLIAQARYAFIDQLCAQVQSPLRMDPRTESLDRLFLHQIWGIPAFIGVMCALFFITIQLGGYLQPGFEYLTRAWIVEPVVDLFRGFGGFFEWLAFAWAGLGLGLVTIATFIPVIGLLFLCLSFLEDCGYMARASFVMDQAMRRVGLPGQALVPLILGLGCNVPAVMAVRALPSARDRILTAMMLPFMSCGARLAIYAVFVSAFFPRTGTLVILGLYLLGIVMALVTAFLLRNSLLIERAMPMVEALPLYHWPRWHALYRQTQHRLWSFIRGAMVVILPLCIVLHILNAVGTDGTWVWEGAHPQAILAMVAKALTPLFSPMGISAENWPATVGLMTGILAKEVVIGTLNALYMPMAGVANASFLEILPRYFDGAAGAIAYLLFILLYMPCVSTVSALRKELGTRWAWWSMLWTTGLAYGMAVGFYQTATFLRHPGTSAAWIVGILAVGAGGMRWFSKRVGKAARPLPTPVVVHSRSSAP